MDVLSRLKQLLTDRGWTEYRLSKECGLAQSTIGNIYRRNVNPSLDFGITLSQFFAEGEVVELTPELKEVFENWVSLTPPQKAAALQMLKAMNHDN